MRCLYYAPGPGKGHDLLELPSIVDLAAELCIDFSAALDTFNRERHDLVLIEAEDIESDAITLCREIRSIAPKDQTVIVLLASNDPLFHRLSLQAGADDVIDRHVDPSLLDVLMSSAKLRAEQLGRGPQATWPTLAIERAVDRMQLGVTITDLAGKILYINDADARMHGYARDELLGESVQVFSPRNVWSPPTLDDARKMKSWRRESVNARKDGSRFPVSLLSDVVLDADGNPVAVVTVSEDITERKQMENELGSARDELTSRVRDRTTELLEANIRLQHEILERRKVERQLLYEALHDSLTDLPNRALFFDRLSRVIAGSERHPDQLFAVLYLDLDQYKVVTESLGHEAGDRLLIQVAHRLRNSIRPEDTIGCAGGDEFFVLVEDLRDANDVTRVARRIRDSLSTPMEISGQTLFVTASIGIALSTTGYERSEDMIRDAQIAMFRAQASSEDGHVIFDREMHDIAVARLKLEMELRQAVDGDSFNVLYQPIVALDNGHIEGFEALARWESHSGEPVSPYEFIPLAEEIGTIFDLEQQILRRVCIDLKKWREEFGDNAPYVSVNLSGKELANPNFARQVARTMAEFDVNPRWLRFEITESSIVQNAEVAAEILTELKQLGVRVYIDDFGTGYSSLSSLHSFPIDTLKIDQSFISDPEKPANWEIVRIIIGLARALGLEVIAEGIETAEQLDAIRDLGCGYGQGYLFSRPVSVSEVERFLSSRQIEVA